MLKDKNLLCLWSGRINIAEMVILPNAYSDLLQCPLKSPFNSSQKLKKILKIYMETQRPSLIKTILNNKIIARNITIPDFKLL